jgi:RNA polymerase sigma-70 factor (ECF subfamily)
LGNPDLDFAAVYDDFFHDVCRWVRALGGLGVDHEDIAQEVFLVVERRLREFDGRNLPGWLFKIAALTVSDHKRRAWFKHLVLGRKDQDLDSLPGAGGGGPVALLEKKEERRALARVLERMPEARRVPFVLFEIEGLSGEEIARLLEIPVATVWTRLHYARKEFFALAADERRRIAGRRKP